MKTYNQRVIDALRPHSADLTIKTHIKSIEREETDWVDTLAASRIVYDPDHVITKAEWEGNEHVRRMVAQHQAKIVGLDLIEYSAGQTGGDDTFYDYRPSGLELMLLIATAECSYLELCTAALSFAQDHTCDAILRLSRYLDPDCDRDDLVDLASDNKLTLEHLPKELTS